TALRRRLSCSTIKIYKAIAGPDYQAAAALSQLINRCNQPFCSCLGGYGIIIFMIRSW
ncbi:unnamed protein product, partial [Linum tenue]